MKYASLIQKLNTQPVAMLPLSHSSILTTAKDLITGSMDISDFFDDVVPVYQSKGNVDIITINGVILPSASKFEKLLGAVSLKEVRSAINQAKKSSASTVVFDFKSPGGVVQGIKETAKAIQDLNKSKDTIAYCDEMMASAAYWLGAQCKNILVSQSAVVGSIGVYIAFLTFEKHLALEGIEAEVIQAGKYKTLGINLKDLTQEEREYLQSHVDKTYSEFKAALGGRNLDDETMQGETYDGENALKLKLVDGIQDSFEDLITMLQG